MQIADNPTLFQPLEEDIIRKAVGGVNVNLEWIGQGGAVTKENAGQRLSTRCERETLSRFPRSKAILFTIRTHIRTLDHYAEDPERVRPAFLVAGHSARMYACAAAVCA